MMLLIGIVFIAYFIMIELFTGFRLNFNAVWLFMGVVLILYDRVNRLGKIPYGMFPNWVKMICLILASAGLILFLIVEGCIISGFKAVSTDDFDYVIVLGAQMKKNGPSRVLRKRLDKAYEYAVEHDKVKVIVSGGQGADEQVSEAQGMTDYLVEKGLDESRIIMEDQSKNTYENLTFSGKICDPGTDKIGIVTSNYHIFRAMHIAKKQGYAKITGIPSLAEPLLQPTNMFREFFGIVKDTLFGNMEWK